MASWGSNSFFTSNLSEKVWVVLGLSATHPRGDHQSIVYDDLVLPLMGVDRVKPLASYYQSSQFEPGLHLGRMTGVSLPLFTTLPPERPWVKSPK